MGDKLLDYPAKLLFTITSPYLLSPGMILDTVVQALDDLLIEFNCVEYGGKPRAKDRKATKRSEITGFTDRKVEISLVNRATQHMTETDLRKVSSLLRRRLENRLRGQSVYIKDKLILHPDDDVSDEADALAMSEPLSGS